MRQGYHTLNDNNMVHQPRVARYHPYEPNNTMFHQPRVARDHPYEVNNSMFHQTSVARDYPYEKMRYSYKRDQRQFARRVIERSPVTEHEISRGDPPSDPRQFDPRYRSHFIKKFPEKAFDCLPGECDIDGDVVYDPEYPNRS